MPAVQEALAAGIVKGEPSDVARLAELYAKRHLKPADAPDVQAHLTGYLLTLRETFAADPTYGPVLLARDVQGMAAALNNLRGETQAGFAEVIARLDVLLKEPEIRALVERKQGRHVFLSYSRQNLAVALQIRNTLEDAGHVVWQDTTAIKGGAEWIDSIEDGIKRAYAVVTVVSAEANASRWVRLEFLEAQRRDKPIVPIQVDGCEIPMQMLDINIIPGHPDLQAGLKRVLATLPAPEQAEAVTPEAPVDRRTLEMDYLNRVLLEHSVWQTVYTPMAGVAQIRRERAAEKPRMVTVPCGIDAKFKRRLQQSPLAAEAVIETEQQEYGDILPAVAEHRRLVILGDPGAGKTTTLWAIAAHAASRAKTDPTAPLPVLVRLGEMGQGQSLDARIRAQLDNLAPFYEALLAEKRLLFLLDGLNELPAEGRAENVTQIKALVERCRALGLVAAITCRELDYGGALDLGLPEKIVITPLDPVRIHRFVKGYITEPPDAGARLFWLLAGKAAESRWQAFSEKVGEPFEVFWLADALPDGKHWGWSASSNDHWERWLKQRRQPRSLLQLATNPFMLYMMTQVFTEEGHLPPNRGALFGLFTSFLLLDREGLDEEDAAGLSERLSDLAFAMQAQGEGTSFSREQVIRHLADERDLYRAQSASLLAGGDDLRFTHQLLQEYFAARRLDRERQNGVPAARFWPQEAWWQPQGWEETAILLAGLYSDNTTPVIEWLRDAQPELTVRCVLESGAHTPPESIEALRPRWLPRLTALTPVPSPSGRGEFHDPQPEARAAVGRALALAGLDNRPGVGVVLLPSPSAAFGRGAGGEGILLPDIDWVLIPAGEFIYQDKQKLTLPAFEMSRYPITYAQFQAFIDAPDGFENDEWWEGLTDKYKKQAMAEQSFKYDNHPRESVSWYQAVAFCRWLTAQYARAGLFPPLPAQRLGEGSGVRAEIRLPTEQEWEKAARGTKGLIYPYGNEFDKAKGNTDETGIGQTSAVGLFPNGASPYGVLDMSGNVWEWCLNEYENPERTQIAGEARRVLRGGSWYLNQSYARAVCRGGSDLNNRSVNFGFRVVLGGVPS